MSYDLRASIGLRLLIMAALAVPSAALAQQAAPTAPAQAPKPAPRPAAKPKPAPTAAAPAPAAPAAPAVGGTQPTLLGMFGDWGAYTASPGGKKVCFALAKPSNSTTSPPGRPRDPASCSSPRARPRR